MKGLSTALGICMMIGASASLNGCADPDVSHDDEFISKEERRFKGFGKFFGNEALLFGGDRDGPEPDVGIGVNSYLWKASLETISFMPLKSVDPFGGVIITDWYTPSSTPNERLKVNIRILDRVLRADGLRVSVFRQKRQGSKWVDASVAQETLLEIEEAILTRARQLKQRS